MEAPAPSRTLYVRNLPEKISKQRLRRLLHAAFSAHGRVVWIVAEKTLKLRGQAFITFKQQAGATAALRAMQGADLLGRTMAVAYARQVSDRAQGAAFGGDSKLSRKGRIDARKTAIVDAETQRAEQAAAAAAAAAAATAVASTMVPDAGVAVPSNTPVIQPVITPNHILFVQGLPETVSKDGQPVTVSDLLRELFGRFAGFIEVRLVPGKDDIAFVEFSTENDAAIALSGLNGHVLGTPPRPMAVSFARK